MLQHNAVHVFYMLGVSAIIDIEYVTYIQMYIDL